MATGSQHYVNEKSKVKTKDVKYELKKSHPWFKALLRPDRSDRRRFLDAPTRGGNIDLQVVELTGMPGDVWCVELRVLHSLGLNASDHPRLMAA